MDENNGYFCRYQPSAAWCGRQLLSHHLLGLQPSVAWLWPPPGVAVSRRLLGAAATYRPLADWCGRQLLSCSRHLLGGGTLGFCRL